MLHGGRNRVYSGPVIAVNAITGYFSVNSKKIVVEQRGVMAW